MKLLSVFGGSSIWTKNYKTIQLKIRKPYVKILITMSKIIFTYIKEK